MQNKKTFITILLVFALVLGGSYLLYTKLSPLISADRISGQEQDTGDGSQESETEKILAPDITVYDINGNEVRLSDFAGKPVIMNFWASWCGPCQMEMPDFEAKYLELGDKARGKLWTVHPILWPSRVILFLCFTTQDMTLQLPTASTPCR